MLKKIIVLALISTFFITEIFAQNFSYSNITLTDVTFSGGNLLIRKDDGSGTYTTPQYLSSAVTQAPVAYISGVAPTVMANFSITCASVPDSIMIQGLINDTVNFVSKKVAVNTSTTTTHTFTYPSTVGNKIFTANTVQFYKPYKIDWKVSFNNGATWYLVGSSQNTMYVTRSAPQAEGSNFKWFHTVYDISCRNALTQTTDTGIISKIWQEFTDHVVLNYNNDSLHYYKVMNSPNVTLSALLKYRDAECYTFAQLFLSTIKIQGVVRTNNYVYITPVSATSCGYAVNRFIVKDWVFGTPSGGSICPDYPYVNTYTTALPLLPSPFTAYSFVTAEVTDKIGIPGSCVANPASYFNNHQICLIDGVYYDPCYGVTFPTLISIKTAAFSGWGLRYTSGTTSYCHFTNDMSKTDLTQTITTFN